MIEQFSTEFGVLGGALAMIVTGVISWLVARNRSVQSKLEEEQKARIKEVKTERELARQRNEKLLDNFERLADATARQTEIAQSLLRERNNDQGNISTALGTMKEVLSLVKLIHDDLRAYGRSDRH